MKITAILANHAEVQNNSLYVSGGGIDRSTVPAGHPGPWAVNLGIGVVVSVPWQSTNQAHKLHISMVDADDQPVMVPNGPDSVGPLEVEMMFNIGRPPTLEIGDQQPVCLAVNLPGLPIANVGNYRFLLKIDGSEEAELPFKVAASPLVTYTP